VPPPPRHLLVLRHGQSTWNAEGRWQGQADPPLSAEGEQQARAAVGALPDVPFVRVVTSDLRRAVQTAEILAGPLGLAVDVDPDLREIDVGDWTGLTRPEIEARWPGELARWSAGESESPPGGEPRSTLVARARRAMVRIAAATAAPGEPVLVVAHGALIRHLDRSLGLEPHGVANLAGRWYEVGLGDEAIVPGDLVVLAPTVTGTAGGEAATPAPPPTAPGVAPSGVAGPSPPPPAAR
jgi:probable phosphoglycerate mutase